MQGKFEPKSNEFNVVHFCYFPGHLTNSAVSLTMLQAGQLFQPYCPVCRHHLARVIQELHLMPESQWKSFLTFLPMSWNISQNKLNLVLNE